VIAISTRPSEPKRRLDRAAFLRFVTAFAVAAALALALALALATIAGLVRSAVRCGACARPNLRLFQRLRRRDY
jgi:hypothetical protein